MEKLKRGRPSLFTDKIADEICERLSNGEPLAQICRDEHMPASRTVSDWTAAYVDFSADFARARETGFDAIAMDALNIADETSRDSKRSASGDLVADSEWISRSKLRVETRLRLLAKWDPKRYGDKQLLGSDPDNPLPAGVTVNFKG